MQIPKLTSVILLATLFGCGTQPAASPQPISKKGQSTNSESNSASDGRKLAGKPSGKASPSSSDPTENTNANGAQPSGSSATATPNALALNPELAGPYSVKSYTDGLNDTAYSSAIIYYPNDLRRPLPSTTLSGGYTNTKEQMAWLASHLASHGFVVQVFTPTNPNSTDPHTWEIGHTGSVRKLKSESARAGSPIQGLVDPSRQGVMGFSMGGAGAILAVNSQAEAIRAAISLCPYQPQSLSAKVPMLFVTGTSDFVAVPANVEKAFSAARSDTSRALLSLNGLGHQNITSPGAFQRQLSRYLTTWYQIFLADQVDYKKFLNGAEADADKAQGGIATLNFIEI